MQKNMRATALRLLVVFVAAMDMAFGCYAGEETSIHEQRANHQSSVAQATVASHTVHTRAFPTLALVSP